MCQILGIVNIQGGGLQHSETVAEVAKIMLKEASKGNEHGSGLCMSFHEEQKIYTLKSGNSGAALAQVLELDTSKDPKHILMHTRFATCGSHSAENAHPHISKSGALIHNGWCPQLFDSIKNGWHHNATALQEELNNQNGKPEMISECDSEALSLIFNEDPEKFAEQLIGDEVFAIANLNSDGDRVTLFTQLNTVCMMYSNSLQATVFATRSHVLEAVQEYLGEVWPIVEVDRDMCYYFDGNTMTGGQFDFEAAVDANFARAVYPRKSKTIIPGDSDKWIRKEFSDHSIVYELTGGEITEVSIDSAKNLDEDFYNEMREAMAATDRQAARENGTDVYDALYDERELGDDGYLDKEFSKAQDVINESIKQATQRALLLDKK